MKRYALPRSILPLAAVLAAATALAACDQPNVRITTTSTGSETRSEGVLKVVDALQCPETQGVLTRKGSAEAGGLVCIYAGPKGAEVNLHLVRLDGRPASEALKTFETELAAALPQTHADLAAHAADRRAAEADRRAAQADRRAAQADAEAAQADSARVRLPGVSIDAHGDKARVRIGGLSINADDAGGTVDIRTDDEAVSINATDRGAEIRTRSGGDATRSTWILTNGDEAAQGWRMVGYEARGPAGGPLVVATVRTKENDHDTVLDAAKALVTLNVGR